MASLGSVPAKTIETISTNAAKRAHFLFLMLIISIENHFTCLAKVKGANYLKVNFLNIYLTVARQHTYLTEHERFKHQKKLLFQKTFQVIKLHKCFHWRGSINIKVI